MLKTHSGPRTSVVATSAAAVAARTRFVRVGAAAAASASAVALEYHAAPGERRAAFLYPGSAAGHHYAARRRPHCAELGARARTHRRFVARAVGRCLYPGAPPPVVMSLCACSARGAHARCCRRSRSRSSARGACVVAARRAVVARVVAARVERARARGRAAVLSAVLLYTGAPPPVSVAHAPSIGASLLVSRSRATPIGVPYHRPTLVVVADRHCHPITIGKHKS